MVPLVRSFLFTHVTPMRLATVGVWFAVVALDGCASAGSVRLWSGQICHAAMPDSTLVSINTLIDGEITLSPFIGDKPDTLLLSVAYASNGALGSVRLAAQHGRRTNGASLGRELRAQLSSTATPGAQAYALLIRDEMPRLQPHEIRTECPPMMRNRRSVSQSLDRLASNLESGGREALVWLLVDEAGEVAQSEIRRGTGKVEHDAAFLEVARKARFSPAIIDGFAMPVWVSFALRIEAAPLVVLDPQHTTEWD